LTTSTFGAWPDEGRIHVHWEWHSSVLPFSILHAPESQTLFLGVARLSARVSLPSFEVIGRTEHCLFWGFEQRRGYVLGLAESDCHLYHRDGRIIGDMLVDPPYEVVEHDDHIAFETSTYGTQRVAFPTD
jgi:hypothetical protein